MSYCLFSFSLRFILEHSGKAEKQQPTQTFPWQSWVGNTVKRSRFITIWPASCSKRSRITIISASCSLWSLVSDGTNWNSSAKSRIIKDYKGCQIWPRSHPNLLQMGQIRDILFQISVHLIEFKYTESGLKCREFVQFGACLTHFRP